jgi:deoxyribose-phosphate aldolase
MDARTVDLARLIATSLKKGWRRRGGRGRCTCHGAFDDCCPSRLQGVIEAGATRLGFQAAGTIPAGVAQLIDHTLLKPDARAAEIEQLCREAAEYHFATVCVNPTWVRLCAARLRGTPVGVCAVVGFPLGATLADIKHAETVRVIADGAREVDMVINIGALKSGDLRTVERDIEAVVQPCLECGVISKVIIETVYLTDEEKVTACTLAKAAGADFVKTSTGFGPAGATAADVALMRRVVGGEMGVTLAASAIWNRSTPWSRPGPAVSAPARGSRSSRKPREARPPRRLQGHTRRRRLTQNSELKTQNYLAEFWVPSSKF